MEKKKRRIGDRADGTLIRNLDSMHVIMPMIYPGRCDNEAYISEKIDLRPINAYLSKINENETEFKTTMFHLIVTAFLKTITLRPKMNRFIANNNMYQRNEVSAAFTIKKIFEDDSEEGLAFIHAKDEDTLEQIVAKIKKQVICCRKDKKDASSASMDTFCKLPRPILKMAVGAVKILDKYGKVPKSLIATDPYYSSVVLSNIGSIKLKCGYHHLTNWGTNSVFCIIGQKKESPVYDENGNASMIPTVDLGITIDERIADGYYYSKTIRLLKKLLENPELLELPLSEKIEY